MTDRIGTDIMPGAEVEQLLLLKAKEQPTDKQMGAISDIQSATVRGTNIARVNFGDDANQENLLYGVRIDTNSDTTFVGEIDELLDGISFVSSESGDYVVETDIWQLDAVVRGKIAEAERPIRSARQKLKLSVEGIPRDVLANSDTFDRLLDEELKQMLDGSSGKRMIDTIVSDLERGESTIVLTSNSITDSHIELLFDAFSAALDNIQDSSELRTLEGWLEKEILGIKNMNISRIKIEGI